MDQPQFDRWTRLLSGARSRRQALDMVVGGVLGMATGSMEPREIDARRGRKPKRKLRVNQFGCVNVGGACRGKDAVCCSGICKGEKPKKGERDKSRCVAHDASTCRAGQASADCGGNSNVLCTTSVNDPGFCETTTGGAPYCKGDGRCIACTKDVECERICGVGAACVPCSNCALVGSTSCVGLGTTSCTLPGE